MRRILPCLTLVLALAGCSGMKDLFSAHANVAAEAAGHTLSADSLASLMLEAKGARLTPETAEFIANVWVDYQLFGNAVVTGVMKTDSAAVNEVMWPEITEAIGNRWHDTLMARRTAISPAGIDSLYTGTDSSAVRVMQHILVKVSPQATPADRNVAQRKAAGILARAKGGADFGALARQYTDDNASKQTGGMMHAAPRGAYVTPFDSAAWSLRPGEISGLVASPFGFHIIRRPPLAEVRAQLQEYLEYNAGRRLDSLYMDSLGLARHLKVKSGATAALRSALDDEEGSRTSTKSLATFDGGSLTVREMLRWTGSMPPQMVAQLKSATDTQMSGFVRALAQNILLIDDAKKNGAKLAPEETAFLRANYLATLDTLRYTIGVTADVADSTASMADREKAAQAQVSSYLARLLRREAPARAIPGPMTWYLRDRLPYRLNTAGVARAAEIALARRDSAQAAPQPRAMPGAPSALPQVTAPQGGPR
ncbi:MAG: peptidyl-prolyl cis-trans isomerase [Gemmatimonadetes bacterium]|nr:peptidyl-prolyl cis-trans isomerase [Gemmatimonadota bacterium]